MLRTVVRFALLAGFFFAQAAVAGIELLPGSSPQSTPVRTSFPNPIRIRTFDDATGASIPGAEVRWSSAEPVIVIQPGSCIVDISGPCVAKTDATGVLTLGAYGNLIGHRVVVFSGGGGSVSVDFTAYGVGIPPTLDIVSGDNQRVSSSIAAQPLVVRVTRAGAPAPGVTVSFGVQSGPQVRFGATPPPSSVVSDANGIASSPPFTASSGLGTGHIYVYVTDPYSSYFASATMTFVNVDDAGRSYVPYAPLWWGGEAQAGWGISIPQHGESLFPVLFTYDASGRPTWYVMNGAWVAGIVGNVFTATYERYTGSPYYAFESSKVKMTVPAYGIVQFGGASSSASFNFKWTEPTFPIRQFTLPIAPYDFSPAVPQPERGVSDMWWGGPLQSGWGITIAEQGGNLFLVWFTYDGDGQPVWFSMSEGAWIDTQTWAGPIFRTQGLTDGSGAYVPGSVRETQVGNFKLRFSGTSAATFDYALDGHAGTLNLQRFDY